MSRLVHRRHARENMRAFSRVLIAMVAAFAALFVGAGTSHAGLDNELSLVDGQDRTMTIQQWDTFLNGVFPLDRNRLTREWFHSGKAKYNWTARVPTRSRAPWSWVTRSVSRGRWVWASTSPTRRRTSCSTTPINPAQRRLQAAGRRVITPNLFPGVSISAPTWVTVRYSGSGDVLGRRDGSARCGGGVERAWHRDGCGRWCVAASHSPA